MGIQKFFGVKRTIALLATVVVAATSSPAVAGPITLLTPDRIKSIQGELLGVKDGTYVVDTAIGVVGIAADEVICEGVPCGNDTAEITEDRDWLIISLK